VAATVLSAFQLAGGAWIFLGVLVVGLLAVAFAYYSHTGSEISMRAHGDRGDTDPTAFNDRSQEVRNWSRGTGGPHRRNVPKPRTERQTESLLDPETHAAMRAWRNRLGSAMPSGLNDPVDPASDHIKGPADAVVTVVNYSDFQCPSCRTVDTVLRRLVHELDGELRYAYRHFPLADAHDMALDAAIATEYAATQDRFWEMHDLIYAAKHAPNRTSLRHIAAELGLDPSAMERALSDSVYRKRVAADFATGVSSGANGTPTLFINDLRHDDDLDAQTLRAAVLRAAASARMGL
jgi:Thioredoxin